MADPVAITGVGQVTALGGDVAALAAGLAAGRCGIGPLTLFAHAGRAAIAAEAPDPGPDGTLPPAVVRRLSRSDRFALAAAREACRTAGLAAAERAGAALFVGATTGGMLDTEEAYRRWRAGSRRARPSRFASMPLSTPGAVVGQALGVFGPRATVSTACSSGALAIAAAARAVARGEAAIALGLGVDSLCRLTYAGFDALQALDPEPCRPFDAGRHGLSLGEGAAAVVLERASHARARGARIHALVLGAGVTADAHHVTAPHPEGAGAEAALRRALEAAGTAPDAVGYVNAHGSGTPQNDAIEMGVLRRVLGRRLARVPVSGSKSQVGHCLAAAGAIEAVITTIALRDGILPPTVTLRAPEPGWADVDLVPTAGRRAAIGVAVTSSYGFGGHDVTLVLARPEAVG